MIPEKKPDNGYDTIDKVPFIELIRPIISGGTLFCLIVLLIIFIIITGATCNILEIRTSNKLLDIDKKKIPRHTRLEAPIRILMSLNLYAYL